MLVLLRFPRDFVPRIITASKQLVPDARDYVPECANLTRVLEAALWASVQRDEDRPMLFSISISPKDSPSRVLALQTPMDLTPSALLKFAVATTAEETAVHVGVENGQLRIFGVDTLLGTSSAVSIEVRGPAQLVVKARGTSIAVVAGNTAALIDRSYHGRFRFGNARNQIEERPSEREDRLTRVVQGMLSCGHGGTILLIPKFAELTALPIDLLYPLESAFLGLRDADEGMKSSLDALVEGRSGPELREAHGDVRFKTLLRERYSSAVAKTTSVDGATVLTYDGLLLGFGAKIRSNKTELSVHRRRPIEGEEEVVDFVEDFGGTRHQSAARFVADVPVDIECHAVVASQDGKLSILSRGSRSSVVNCLEHAEWLF